MSEAVEETEALPAWFYAEDGSTLSRLQIKEACRLAYCSGKAKLVELCAKWRVPYDTLARWSKTEDWTVTKAETLAVVDQKLTSKLSEWLVQERESQMKRGLARALRGQQLADQMIDAGKVQEIKDLRDLAAAEKEFDLQARRNLGMESEGSHSGPVINVNALGAVEIHEGAQPHC